MYKAPIDKHQFVTVYDEEYNSPIPTENTTWKWTIECSCGWFAPGYQGIGKDHHISKSAAEVYFKETHLTNVFFGN